MTEAPGRVPKRCIIRPITPRNLGTATPASDGGKSLLLPVATSSEASTFAPPPDHAARPHSTPNGFGLADAASPLSVLEQPARAHAPGIGASGISVPRSRSSGPRPSDALSSDLEALAEDSANEPATSRSFPDPGGVALSEFLKRCGNDPTSASVFDAFRAAAEASGYSRLALAPVSPAAQRALGLAETAPVLTTNAPERWVRHYFACGYQLVDPVLMHVPRQTGPLLWADLLASGALSPKQRRVLTESRDAGIYNGVSIPLHGPGGETWVASLATEDDTPPAVDRLEELQVLAIHFFLAFNRSLHRQGDEAACVRLTDRERECLTWTARGKSAWSIGVILEVSEHTVNFHLKRCMAKLGAANRMQAVVAALRVGLILP